MRSYNDPQSTTVKRQDAINFKKMHVFGNAHATFVSLGTIFVLLHKSENLTLPILGALICFLAHLSHTHCIKKH